MTRRGRFITFEGLDGCGKSTQVKRLATTLMHAGYEVVTAREPGTTAIGERVRAIILDSRTKGMAPMTEVALMFSARAQLVAEVVRPAVKAGKIVLCDRHTDSTEAYQGGGRQLGSDLVRRVHKLILGDQQPDLTLLLLSDAASVERARRRNVRNAHAGDENRFELEQAEFFARVRRAYLAIAKREPKRVAKIDAGRSIPDVHEAIVKAVHERLHMKI
ncbi:MAG: dTMP kinase [Acidobacteriales bacterium]|nr:dTMP kinase [Terriglobales bacterium]